MIDGRDIGGCGGCGGGGATRNARGIFVKERTVASAAEFANAGFENGEKGKAAASFSHARGGCFISFLCSYLNETISGLRMGFWFECCFAREKREKLTKGMASHASGFGQAFPSNCLFAKGAYIEEPPRGG